MFYIEWMRERERLYKLCAPRITKKNNNNTTTPILPFNK